ncbi:hypothetical protein [Paenibacillus xylanexedens]|uniref:hypothetical protein n=1 Tax=Paenibacillus xylanexedens TaxID=528191 RepID=UPI0011A4FFB9|nr:hypothetical protein [Paenibacillus xylanexedens]
MRRYISELGIEHEDTPQGYFPGDKREDKWKSEREEYGFDSRETWSLNYSFKLWLYERLQMYDEINIVDTSFHKFTYKEELITFQECIDRMIEGLKLDLTLDEYDPERKLDECKNKITDVLPLFCICCEYLWW